MAVPQLTRAQSRRRIAELWARGCDVAVVTHPSGDKTVMKRCPPKLLENQTPAPNAIGYLVLAAFAGAALYAIFRPKRAAAATATPPADCTAVTPQSVELYGRTFNVSVVQLANETTPPAGIARQDGRIVLYGASGDQLVPFSVPGTTEPQSFAQPLVVILGNGEFWRYEGPAGQAVQEKLSPRDRENFCSLARGGGAVTGVRWMD
jgi:hypothetical protein